MSRARMQPDVKNRLLDSLSRDVRQSRQNTGGKLVVEKIRQWIFEGLLRDGDILSQEDIAELLGMSRIPVRDGLIALQSAGWVRLVPGIGATAVGLDAGGIKDFFEVLATLWKLLIARAVQHGGDYGTLLDSMQSVEKARTPAEMATASADFLLALCEVGSAPRLEAAFHSPGTIVPSDFFAVVPRAMEVQRMSVRAIGRAVVRGDIAAATASAEYQCRTHAKNVIQLLSQRGVLEDIPRRAAQESG
jgi:DNA-binding GntR family transcriptional regulator